MRTVVMHCLVSVMAGSVAVAGPDVVRTYVFQGEGDAALACGPVLGIAPNGDWLCAWLGGGRAEPHAENKGVVARSTDAGRTWSKPGVALPSPGTILDLYAQGAHVWALGFEYEPDSNYTVKRPCRMFSDDNGKTWSGPEYLAAPRQNLALESHIEIQSGEWLFPAYFMEPRADPLLGGTRREYTHTIGCCVAISGDKGATFITDELDQLAVQGSIDNRPLGLHEPRIVQLDSGRIVMLMRAQFDGWLWRAHSDNSGRTWSNAVRTGIPNPSAKVWIGKLKDGRIALALNPTDQVRNPLELWISDDDAVTWPRRITIDRYEANYSQLTARGNRHDPGPGWGKGGAWPPNLSYPFVLEHGGALHIAYDVARRDIVIATLNMNDL